MGPVHLAVQVRNQGGAEAAAGAVVRVHTRTGDPWREVASSLLVDPIPALTVLEGVAFELPLSDWGEQQVVEVSPAHADACDYVNDRVPVGIEVCE